MLLVFLGAGSVPSPFAQTGAQPPTPAPVAFILSIEPPTNHGVRVMRAGAAEWSQADVGMNLHAGDLFQTDAGRAVLRFAEDETISVAKGTTLQIRTGRKRGPKLLRGLLHFFHRGSRDEFEAETPLVGAIIRGTEFHLEVNDDLGKWGHI